jgi:hypothetical protein
MKNVKMVCLKNSRLKKYALFGALFLMSIALYAQDGNAGAPIEVA